MIFKITVMLCVAAWVAGDVGPGRNAYLPPKKGYSYPTPSIPFTIPTTPSTPTKYTPTKYTPTRPPPVTYPPTRYTTPGDHIPDGNQEHEHHHHHHHEPGMPFDFAYSVNDVEHGNDYSHNAVSDGDITRGEYRIQLPDGRVQVVKYTADWKNGFNAQVRFEGQPNFNPYKGSG